MKLWLNWCQNLEDFNGDYEYYINYTYCFNEKYI